MHVKLLRKLMLMFVALANSASYAQDGQEKFSTTTSAEPNLQVLPGQYYEELAQTNTKLNNATLNAKTKIIWSGASVDNNEDANEIILPVHGLIRNEGEIKVEYPSGDALDRSVLFGGYSFHGIKPSIENTFYLPIDDNIILDPAFATDRDSLTVLQNIYETLVSFDNNNQLKMAAAQSYTVSADGLNWQFVLNPNLRWSDGSRVTANDFIRSWQRLLSLSNGAPNSHLVVEANIVNAKEILNGHLAADQLGVEAVDDLTINIALSKPTPWLLSILASPALSPIHENTVRKANANDAVLNGDMLDLDLVTNGAYRFVHVDQDPFLLVKNSYYWDARNVHFIFIGGASYRGICGQFGDFEANRRNILYVNKGNRDLIETKYKDQIKTIVYPETKFLEFNLKDKVVANLKVRQALSLLVDREYFAQMHHNSATVATTLAPPEILEGGKVVSPAATEHSAQQNYQQAQQLLRDLGYSAQHPLVLDYVYSIDFLSENQEFSNPTFHDQLAFILENNSANLIKVKATGYRNDQYFNALRDGAFQLTSFVWRSAFNHAHSFYSLLESEGADNFARYNSSSYDALIRKVRYVTDAKQREQIYTQAQNLLSADLPIIPLIWSTEQYVARNYVNKVQQLNFTGVSVKDIDINDQLFARFRLEQDTNVAQESTQNQLESSIEKVSKVTTAPTVADDQATSIDVTTSLASNVVTAQPQASEVVDNQELTNQPLVESSVVAPRTASKVRLSSMQRNSSSSDSMTSVQTDSNITVVATLDASEASTSSTDQITKQPTTQEVTQSSASNDKSKVPVATDAKEHDENHDVATPGSQLTSRDAIVRADQLQHQSIATPKANESTSGKNTVNSNALATEKEQVQDSVTSPVPTTTPAITNTTLEEDATSPVNAGATSNNQEISNISESSENSESSAK